MESRRSVPAVTFTPPLYKRRVLYRRRGRHIMRVAIIGAGIGGLTAAIGLQRAGAEVTVLERAAGPAFVGAGLSLFGNGFTALDAVGLDLRHLGTPRPDLTAGQRRPDGRWLSVTPSAALHELRRGAPRRPAPGAGRGPEAGHDPIRLPGRLRSRRATTWWSRRTACGPAPARPGQVDPGIRYCRLQRLARRHRDAGRPAGRGRRDGRARASGSASRRWPTAASTGSASSRCRPARPSRTSTRRYAAGSPVGTRRSPI